MLPPLNAADWAAEFALYQATPEFREINGPAGMDLAAFKHIYFWEWFHRLLGRLVGLAMVAAAGLVRGPPRHPARLWLAAGRAGCCSVGVPGRAGLVHGPVGARRPHRRQPFPPRRRILLTALFILAGLVWTALDLRQLARPATTALRG